MDGFVKVCLLDQIPLNEPLVAEVDGQPIALCRVGDKVFALEDVCPHQAASFEGGEIEDGILTCPLHGWRADIKTGQSLEAPSMKITTFETRIEDGFVFVKIG